MRLNKKQIIIVAMVIIGISVLIYDTYLKSQIVHGSWLEDRNLSVETLCADIQDCNYTAIGNNAIDIGFTNKMTAVGYGNESYAINDESYCRGISGEFYNCT